MIRTLANNNINMAEDSEFRFVSRRKRGKRFPRIIGDYESREKVTEREIDVDQLTRKLNNAKDELIASQYVKVVFQGLTRSAKILNAPGIKNLLCYGLGNFSEQKHSRYQLALLLIVRERFGSNVYLYDPLFSPQEVKFLETLDCRVLEENEEGKRRVESTTLIYLPHCPKQLTNNFLYANWSPGLKNCILLCNSFSKILQSHTSSVLNNTAKYIVRISPFVEEIELANSFEDQNVFSDSALHVFTQENLNRVSKPFWEDKEEPRYLREDIEFITNSVSQKLSL